MSGIAKLLNISGQDYHQPVINSHSSEVTGLSSRSSLFGVQNDNTRRMDPKNEQLSQLNAENSILPGKGEQQQFAETKSEHSEPKKPAKKSASNSISNDKKALGQVGFLSLATILALILAPVTGGASLIPTAFVVLFGNATAMAMYGGSRHFVDDTPASKKDKHKSPSPQEEPESPIQNWRSPPRPVEDIEAEEPDISETDNPGIVNDVYPESAGDESNRINRVAAEEDAVEDRGGEEPVSLEQIITQLEDVPVIRYAKVESEIDQWEFNQQLTDLADAEDIVALVDQGHIAQEMIHLADGTKIYVLGKMPEVAEHDLRPLVPSEAAVEVQEPPVVNAEGAEIGVNHNVGVPNTTTKAKNGQR